MKWLEAHGVPRRNIIDGRVFKVPNLDFPRLLAEGVAYSNLIKTPFNDFSSPMYPRVYLDANKLIKLGAKSYIGNTQLHGDGIISVEKFCGIAYNILFELKRNGAHNYRRISSFDSFWFDWQVSREFFPPAGVCQINIGSDVWIGRGSILKSNNPARPLVIGDGAVIASDSVVVKSVPPYAIVGGNPAQLIRYRFSEDIIAALLRIKWWDWDIDKIYEEFKYFNRVEEFVARNDKGV